ncbi:MAG: tetratricopeptide repeat protein [Gemmatimonadales bacterium]
MSGSREARTFAAADTASFLGTFGLVFVAIAALLAVNTVLANMERAENRAEARYFFQEGVRLAEQGRRLEAVDRFRTAMSSERTNPLYQRALAAALLAAGKVADAEAVIADRLQRDPADAAASRIMAQALVRQGKWRPAVSYYHRAIHGNWDQDSVANRVAARFELVDLLARQDSKQELLAELLPLQHGVPADVATRRRIARLFIAAGSPSRAIEIFRAILRKDRSDADAYAGLGEAELERGNFRTARANFQAASRLAPNAPEIAAALALGDQVLSLDPTQRGLASEEQYRRSLALLELTWQAVQSCAPASTQGPLQATVDSARTTASQRASAASRRLSVERNLDLAERLWQLRRTECPRPIGESERPMELVLERVAQ